MGIFSLFASSFMEGWRSGQQGAAHAAPSRSVPHTPHLFYPSILPHFDELTSGGHNDPRALVYSLSWLDPGRKRPFSCDEINALDFGPGKIGEKKACRILLENGLIRFLDLDGALAELHTIQELKDLLRQRGLPISGNKPVLAKRLADSGFKAGVRDCSHRVLELTESGIGRIEESRLDGKRAYFLAVDALKEEPPGGNQRNAEPCKRSGADRKPGRNGGPRRHERTRHGDCRGPCPVYRRRKGL